MNLILDRERELFTSITIYETRHDLPRRAHKQVLLVGQSQSSYSIIRVNVIKILDSPPD